MIYTITFNPALDYIVWLPHLVPNQVNRTERENLFYGGKGVNVSVILGRLGIESVALGFVAGFTGKELEARVKKQGVQTDFVYLEEGQTRINIKMKGTDYKEETEVNAQGPNISEDKLEELFQKLKRLTKDDILVLAGSIPNTLPSDVYEQIMQRLSSKGVSFVVDATGALLRKVLKYHPFLIKPNNHELGEIFGRVLETEEDIIFYAKELQKEGARNVLVSMAGDGAILVTEQGMFHKIGVAKGTVINSVGAGDSMVAGFVAGYKMKKDYGYALKLGTAAGGATAFSEDLATKEKIAEVLAQL